VKLFDYKEAQEAIDYAKSGGQALHLMRRDDWAGNAPAIFMEYVEWGHLIDMDETRLVKTAQALGVREIVIGRKGRDGQHVDLCGGPLTKAKQLCE
jgi:hypothetical protein